VKTASPWPLVKIIQANNINSTQKPFVELASATAANVPFRSGGGSRNTSFSNISQPEALYYDGVSSDINIYDVSAVGDIMTFKIGTVFSSSSVASSSSSSSIALSSSSSIALSSSSVAPSSSSRTSSGSSSSSGTVSALKQQIITGNILAYAKGNAIILENSPQGAKIEVYSLQGKRIYSTFNQIIPVKTNGIYIIRVSGETLRVVIR